MPCIYEYDQRKNLPENYIYCYTQDGARYKIRFDRITGGIEVNKTTDDGASERITVSPEACNQIVIK